MENQIDFVTLDEEALRVGMSDIMADAPQDLSVGSDFDRWMNDKTGNVAMPDDLIVWEPLEGMSDDWLREQINSFKESARTRLFAEQMKELRVAKELAEKERLINSLVCVVSEIDVYDIPQFDGEGMFGAASEVGRAKAMLHLAGYEWAGKCVDRCEELVEELKNMDSGISPIVSSDGSPLKNYVGKFTERNGEREYTHQVLFQTVGNPAAYMDGMAFVFFEDIGGDEPEEGAKGYYFNAGCLHISPVSFKEVDALTYAQLQGYLESASIEQDEYGRGRVYEHSFAQAESMLNAAGNKTSDFADVKSNFAHFGPVLGLTDLHVVQSCGRGYAVIYNKADLPRVPCKGEDVLIQGRDGLVVMSAEKAVDFEIGR